MGHPDRDEGESYEKEDTHKTKSHGPPPATRC